MNNKKTCKKVRKSGKTRKKEQAIKNRVRKLGRVEKRVRKNKR